MYSGCLGTPVQMLPINPPKKAIFKSGRNNEQLGSTWLHKCAHLQRSGDVVVLRINQSNSNSCQMGIGASFSNFLSTSNSNSHGLQ